MPQTHPFSKGTQVIVTIGDININGVKGEIKNFQNNPAFGQYEYAILIYCPQQDFTMKFVLAERVEELNP